MRRHVEPTFAFALCASLVLHAIGIGAMVRQYVRAGANLELPPASSRQVAVAVAMATDPGHLFGDAVGRGDAANASPGELPMIGREAPEVQAFLSRDPVGAGAVGDDPSMSVMPQAAAAAAALATPPVATAVPIGVSSFAADLQAPAVGRDATTLVRTKDAPLPTPSADESNASSPAAASNAPAADPAIMSDSESDPFSTAEHSVVIRDGRVDVKLGRKVKTVRPRLSLAAQYDLIAMQFPRIVVRVNVDAEGAVRKVEITRSSGSDGADQAVKVALYQWWFEPKRDAGGHATADVVEFPITWR